MNKHYMGYTAYERSTLKAYRTEAQQVHGERVELRQRVNGQPNGYAPWSEPDRTLTKYESPASGYKPTHGGYSA